MRHNAATLNGRTAPLAGTVLGVPHDVSRRLRLALAVVGAARHVTTHIAGALLAVERELVALQYGVSAWDIACAEAEALNKSELN